MPVMENHRVQGEGLASPLMEVIEQINADFNRRSA
jgi:hypothetical protein